MARPKPEPTEEYDEAAADRSFAKLAGIIGGYLTALETWVRDDGPETYDGPTRDTVYGVIATNERALIELARIKAAG